MSEKIVHPNQLQGLFELVKAKHPQKRLEWTEETYEHVKNVYEIGQQIICLHIIEILLKYIHQERGIQPPKIHDIKAFFNELPEEEKRKAEEVYKDYVFATRKWTYNVCESIESLFDFLGDRPIVDMRYFWEEYENVPIFRGDLINAFQAILVAMLDIDRPPIIPKYQTEFRALPQGMKIKKGDPE